MDPWAVVLLVGALCVGVSIGVLYAIPATRPFIKTWWPAFVVVLLGAVVVALVVTGRRKGPARKKDPLDQAIEKAKESITDAKLEAALRKQESATAYQQVTEKLAETNKHQDVFQRHLEKRLLLDRVRRDL